MSRKPAKRRKRERRGQARRSSPGNPRSQRRKAYARLFRRLGLAESWQRLPKRCKAPLHEHDALVWQVRLTRRAKRHERAADLAQLVEDVLDNPRFGCECGDGVVTLREAIELLAPLAHQVRHAQQAWQGEPWSELVEGLEELWPVLDDETGGLVTLFDRIDEAVFLACAQTNSFDRPYATVHFWNGWTSGGLTCRFTIDLEPDQERRFVIKGKPRKAYRVGLVEGADGLHWVDVPGAMFGLGTRMVPAYMQRHVLHRLWQRLELDAQRYMANLMIIHACREAHVVQRDGYACWLSVTTVAGERLGYLIAEPHDGVVLIKTFTFITDSDAPEARRLRKQLHEAGYRYKQLGLDRLSTYLRGEVPDDPQLHAIFAEAGCAHLLDLAEDATGSENRRVPAGPSR